METVDLKAKAGEINLILAEPRVNLWKLRELSLTEGGLVNDLIRRRAWPKLVGLHDYYLEPAAPTNTTNSNNKNGAPTGSNAPPRPPRAGRPPSSSTTSSAFTPVMINNLPPALPSNPTNSIDDDDTASLTSIGSLTTLNGKKPVPPSLDADQISRDVARCTWHLLTGTQRSRRVQMKNKHRRKVATVLKRKQQRLGNLINLTLLKTYEDDEDAPKLRYYQGFHDVASICLSTLGGGGRGSSSVGESDSITAISASMGLDLPSAVLAQISTSHFGDAMQANFLQLQTAIRLVLMPLICYFDPEVHDFLVECDMEPFFALSWIITWFSHDIRDTDLVKRLFDAFLVSHPLLPLYMTVAMVCHPNNRHEVLNAEPDFAVLHSVLSNLPKNSSMVGWKYRPTGEGYVSGEEGDEENSMDVSIVCDLEGTRTADDDMETQSMVSSTVSGGLVKAPFQEIIDQSLDFMKLMPPRTLIPLVKRYFTDDALKPMMQIAPSISLLKPEPPKWGLTSTTTADWVLKQRARQRDGNKRKKNRRSRSTSSTRSTEATVEEEDDDEQDDDEMTRLLITQETTNLAVIACGYGPGDDNLSMQRRKRKQRRIIAASVAVALLAVGLAAFLQSKNDGVAHVTNNIMIETDHKANRDVVFLGRRKTGDINTTGGDKKRTLASTKQEDSNLSYNDDESMMEEAATIKTKLEEEDIVPLSAPRTQNETPPKEPNMNASKHKEPAVLKEQPSPMVVRAGKPVVKNTVVTPKEQLLTRRDEEFVTGSLDLVDKVIVSSIARVNHLLHVTVDEPVKRAQVAVRTVYKELRENTVDARALTSRDEEFIAGSLAIVDKVIVSNVERFNHLIHVALDEQAKRVQLAVHTFYKELQENTVDEQALTLQDEDFVASSLELVDKVIVSNVVRVNQLLQGALEEQTKLLQAVATVMNEHYVPLLVESAAAVQIKVNHSIHRLAQLMNELRIKALESESARRLVESASDLQTKVRELHSDSTRRLVDSIQTTRTKVTERASRGLIGARNLIQQSRRKEL